MSAAEPTPQPPSGDPCFDSESPGDVRRFRASDGYEFAYRHFPAKTGQPRGHVVALHGIQSHSGWYGYSAGRMAAAGYDVRFLDRRGSGLNDVDRGHAPHAERLMNDVVQFLTSGRHEQSHDAGTILLGVSWGGKLAASVAARRPELVDALALLYPGIRPRIRATLRQRFLLKLADAFDIHRKVAPIPLRDPALFTDDAQWQERIRDDPFALHEATSGFFLSSANLDRLIDQTAGAIHCPALLMLAGNDRIIDNRATRLFFDGLSSAEKTLLEYEAAAHTLEFEPNRDAIVSDLIEWLNRVRQQSRRLTP